MLPEWYKEYKNLIESSINTFLDKYFEENQNQVLDKFKEVVYYWTKWWKKLRAILALVVYLNSSKKDIKEINKDSDIIKLWIAIELLHAYSLIHDDLPAMDNDLYRRWEKTVWNNFSETDAILVWDMLNSLAFECLSSIQDKEIWMQIISLFWKSVWFYGMVWGQVLDLYYEKNDKELDLEKLIELHNKKTWALIIFSILSWALLTKSKNNEKLKNFWKDLWLAFQIKDDILDVIGTLEETWKSVWWEKKWFINLLWLEKSEEFLEKLINNCFLNIKDLKDEKLEFLVKYTKERTK